MSNELGVKLVEALEDTCDDLESALEELGYEIDTIPFEALVYLDSCIARCACCDWWVDVSHLNMDGVCLDCN